MLRSRLAFALSLLAGSAMLSAQDSLNVQLLFHWDDPSIPPANFHLNQYNEVWGYAQDGREYAIIGSSLGTHFFDVTDPVNATQVAFVEGAISGSLIIHRDMKDYAGHLFIVADEGASTLQVVDMQYLPDSVHKVYDSSTLLYRAHNIFIDTAIGRMYTCGGSTPFSIYDITTPAMPVQLVDCEADIPWWGGTVNYVHDAYVRDNIAYCNAVDALYVVDFSDLQNPAIIGSLQNYPDPGYNHSGWLDEDQDLFVMCDETHGMRMKLLDVSDLSDIQVNSLLTTGVDALSIPHNVVLENDRLHAAYYHDGYWLWDVIDPTQPALLGFYDTSAEQHALNYKGAWGVYPNLPSGLVLISDMQEGLFVLDITDALAVGIEGSDVIDMFTAFPNPFDGALQIMRRSGNSLVTAELFDLTGRSVHIEHNWMMAGDRWNLATEHVVAGNYILHLAMEQGTYSIPVMQKGGR